MADNWYIVLELEFDPPVEDEQKIAAKIEERQRYWSTNFNHFKLGPQYRTWHQSIPQIKKDMIGPANIRKMLAEEACALTYGPVDKLLKTIGRKGNITKDECDKLSQKLKVDVEVVKRRAAKLGIKVENPKPVDYQTTYDKYYKNKPQDAATFDVMKQDLAAFHVDNLYDFLYAGTMTKNASTLPCATLVQRSKERKTKDFYKTDATSGIGSRLCAKCDIIFKSEESKKAYDAYLDYVRRKDILDRAKVVGEISGELDKTQAEELINQLTQLFKDRKLAQELLVAFCKVEHIRYDDGNGGKTVNKNIKICRCGCINDVSDGRKVCSNCGLELQIKCPKCGALSDANIKVCKCGFSFESIDRALALCEQAGQAIDALDFVAAKALLDDANRYWPGNTKTKPLKDRLTEVEQRVGKEVSKMREALKAKKYCETKNLYAGIKRLFPAYCDAAIEEEFTQAITKAQAIFARAKAAKVDSEILELCAQAYDICADLPGVRELMPAPQAVTVMTVRPNGNTRTNIVSWNTTADRSIRYVVVRSASAWIRQIADGETVFRGSASSYTDTDIIPGVTYYYNVFAERAGVYSQAAKGASAFNLFEISGLAATPANGSLNITWNKLPKGATAEVYELNAGGMRKLIAKSTSDCHLISGLNNGTTYRYHVLLSYTVAGQREQTAGLPIEGTPDSPPAPIDTLRVKPAEGEAFDAVWSQEANADVRLFCSTRKPKYNLGDMVPLSTLTQEMRPLQQRPLSPKSSHDLKPGERGASFLYSAQEILYVVAVVVKNNSAVFGTLSRAARGENVKINAIRPVNGKISISLEKLPANATGFVVLYRHDRFPTDLSDITSVRKYIPLKHYQLNGSILLDTLENKSYYFSVFAEFKIDDEKDYSSGTDYLFDNSPRANITYSISVTKKFFGGNSVTLEFESGGKPFELPDIDIMSAIGNTPMFKSSATMFHSIPAQHVNSSLSVSIPLKGIPRDTYIKAFFRDENAHSGSQLQIKLGSNYKIS